MKPIWLLDVDGVLNAVVGYRKEYPATWRNWEQQVLGGFTITWSPDLMERINKLLADDLVEIRWLTTWREEANAHLITPFGLTEMAVCPDEDLGRCQLNLDDEWSPHEGKLSSYTWWKFPAARFQHLEGRPLIWTDDDLQFEPNATKWVAEVDNVLAISPDTAVGLTPGDLDRIEAFCKECLSAAT